jgi:inward rectifier potassium channel
MKKKLTKRRHNRVSIHAGQVEFVKVNVGDRQWREVYQWLLALRWPQFAALVAAFYIALNLLFATLYAIQRDSIAGTTGGRWFYDCFFFSVQTLATVGYGHMYPQTLYGHVVRTRGQHDRNHERHFFARGCYRIDFCSFLASGSAHCV